MLHRGKRPCQVSDLVARAVDRNLDLASWPLVRQPERRPAQAPQATDERS
jgi:hypothetical protein